MTSTSHTHVERVARSRARARQAIGLSDVRRLIGPIAAVIVALACLVWSYWPIVRDLWMFWQQNDDYSAGQLVPIAALFLVWRQRAELADAEVRAGWGGLGLLVAAETVRIFGMYFAYGSAERLALVMAIAGSVWLVVGRHMAWRLRWVLAFCLLMLPFPGRVHDAISIPLQELATRMAAASLEVLGFFVVREGHVLRLDEQTIVGVTEACSGLRMLTAFLIVSAFAGLVIRRPAWQRLCLVAASIPIAVLSNTVRAIATAVVVHYSSSTSFNEAFHDWAGLAMMPLAILLLVGLVRGVDWFTSESASDKRSGTDLACSRRMGGRATP